MIIGDLMVFIGDSRLFTLLDWLLCYPMIPAVTHPSPEVNPECLQHRDSVPKTGSNDWSRMTIAISCIVALGDLLCDLLDIRAGPNQRKVWLLFV